MKCAQYWPHREEGDATFEDTNFKLTLVSEDIKSYYTVRQLELENLSVSDANTDLQHEMCSFSVDADGDLICK